MLACIMDYFTHSKEYKEVPQGYKFGDLLMSYKSIFQDIRNAVDYIHMNGELKRRICDNLSEYVKKDANLNTLLKRLQQAGRKTFLLTNSEWWYTNEVGRKMDRGNWNETHHWHWYPNQVMNYLLDDGTGESWESHFNYVIVDAQKPSFFGEGTVLR